MKLRARVKASAKGYTMMREIPDGVDFLSAVQAATLMGVSESQVHRLCKSGQLFPARIRKRYILTRADVERFIAVDREKALVAEFEKGTPPMKIYRLFPNLTLAQLSGAMDVWAKLTGVWIVQGPPGSFARWLDRFGLISLTPQELRRIIEVLLSDQHTIGLARIHIVESLSKQKPTNGQAKR